MRTLHIKTLLTEYIYKLKRGLIKNWNEFKFDNHKALRHFNTYVDACLFVERYNR